jgi:serine/threonine protein kinase
MVDITAISNSDLVSLQKEVNLQTKIQSAHCVKLHASIKTSSNLYMIQDYCNGGDL